MATTICEQGPSHPGRTGGPLTHAPGEFPPLAFPHWSAEAHLAPSARPSGAYERWCIPPPLPTGAAILSVAGPRRVGGVLRSLASAFILPVFLFSLGLSGPRGQAVCQLVAGRSCEVQRFPSLPQVPRRAAGFSFQKEMSSQNLSKVLMPCG